MRTASACPSSTRALMLRPHRGVHASSARLTVPSSFLPCDAPQSWRDLQKGHSKPRFRYGGGRRTRRVASALTFHVSYQILQGHETSFSASDGLRIDRMAAPRRRVVVHSLSLIHI